MTEATLSMNSFETVFQTVRALLGATGADLSVRDAAWSRFCALGLPTTRDEEFKYLPLNRLYETVYGAPHGATVSREQVAATGLTTPAGFTLAFLNAEPAPELSMACSLPRGVVVTTLSQAREEMPELVEKYLSTVATFDGKLGSTNDARFVDLNDALWQDGAFVYVPAGVVVEDPIQIVYVTTANLGPIMTQPRTLVVMEQGALARVAECFVGLEGQAFVNPLTEVVLGSRANLEHLRFQDETLESVHIGNIFVHQEADSVYSSINTQFGGDTGRVDLNVFINGEHTETWLDGIVVGAGEQTLENHTRIDHAKPNCNSFEVYKNVLKDKASGSFNGKIFVYEDAQKTDAKQTNQGMLLSPTATFNTKPQLEIFADDVKCTHGATVGQLREDALFYLRARGIPKDQAQALLVYAFAAEVIEKVKVDSLREMMTEKVRAKLS
jgi:Fe-S cluster assembly protein SufD